MNKKSNHSIVCLDLEFLNIPGAIASYLIPHANGGVLIETGPTSTFQNLIKRLKEHGYDTADITDIFLTHIHLDHCGAVGIFARNGTKIHVHPKGAHHLVDPTKLISSASRIYGDSMDILWGEFSPVNPSLVYMHHDFEIINIENIQLQVIETPGHAKHHYTYVYDHVCFTGDIGGVRLEGSPYIVLPTPPPDLDMNAWRQSLKKIENIGITQIAPTHYGIYDDLNFHLNSIYAFLDDIENWLRKIKPAEKELDIISHSYSNWIRERMEKIGIDENLWEKYEMVNPSWMSASGLYRYWNNLSMEK